LRPTRPRQAMAILLLFLCGAAPIHLVIVFLPPRRTHARSLAAKKVTQHAPQDKTYLSLLSKKSIIHMRPLQSTNCCSLAPLKWHFSTLIIFTSVEFSPQWTTTQCIFFSHCDERKQVCEAISLAIIKSCLSGKHFEFLCSERANCT
jgi:hypothetical protein